MSRTIKIYLIALVVLFAAVTVIEFSKPRPLNWTKTFNETHKHPFGTFIFYSELRNLFPYSEVKDLGVTVYEYFNGSYNWERNDYDIHGTYIYLDEAMEMDEISAGELLDFVSYGNDAFISSGYLPQIIKDSLDINLEVDYNLTGKADLYLVNSRIRADSTRIERGLTNIFFSEVDTLNTIVLGTQRFNKERKVNFIKVEYGDGYFYLHLQPVIFTNYYLLRGENKEYAAGVLSYLSDETIFFDSRNKNRNFLSQSPMRYILSQPALRWAWLMGLLSIIAFILFNAKRKQRIVPVLKPNENSTVAFTKTIGNLYYETRDHTNIIDKKITYFLEHIRRVYYLDTQLLDERFMKSLAMKSGKNHSIVKKLINMIAHLKAKPTPDENDLLELNNAMENFYNN